jgi:formate/nitrite transporter FocA (FNT family)
MKKLGKKGAFSLGDLPNVALTFVLIGVFFAVGLVILASLQANTTVSSNVAANAAVYKTTTALSEIPNNWLLLIAVIVAAAIVIGIVISNLGRGSR